MNLASELLSLLKNESDSMNLRFARVSATIPVLTLEINGQNVHKFVYTLNSVGSLSRGDLVMVAREGEKFFIIGRVRS